MDSTPQTTSSMNFVGFLVIWSFDFIGSVPSGSGSGCVRVCFVRALVDLQPTSALVERRVRAYLHSSELDDFSYPWPDTQSGCQSVRVCKALRGGVRTSASTSRIGGAPLPAVPALRGTPYALVEQSDYEARK